MKVHDLVKEAILAERQACAKIASQFTIKEDASIYPGMPFNDMNETAKMVSHTTAQQISLAIMEQD